MRFLKYLLIFFLFLIYSACTYQINKPIRTVVIKSNKKLENIVEFGKKITFYLYIQEDIIGGKIYGGTAFVIGKDGYLATVYHAINKPFIKILVELRENGLNFSKQAKVVAFDKKTEVAILKVEHKFKYVAQFRHRLLHSGEFAYSVGYPRGNPNTLEVSKNPPTVSFGNFYKYDYLALYKDTKKVLVQSFTIVSQKCSSGSPIFDKDGKVAGIAVSIPREKVNIKTNKKERYIYFDITIATPVENLFHLFLKYG